MGAARSVGHPKSAVTIESCYLQSMLSRNSFFFAACLLGAACGGSSAAPHDTTDAADDRATAEDASCGAPVWTPASLTFTLTSSGGFAPPPPQDAGCTTNEQVYDFSAPEKTLVQHSCSYTGRIDRLVHLTDAETAAIVASVGALRTTCTKGCGADAPEITLTVRASGIETKYTSNFYAGCPGATVPDPLVSFESLAMLEGSLGQIATNACSTEGGPASPARCANTR
jgi:hypothetical protein